MSRRKRTGNVRAGAAGHEGHDRQPPEETTPKEVASRSHEATALQHQAGKSPDIAHPGPERFDCEKSKGDAHHNQHEKEKDMQKKVERL